MIGPVDLGADGVLQPPVAHGFLFTGEDRCVIGELVASLDHRLEQAQHVVAMDEGLARIGIAGMQVALEAAIVDPGDLMRQCRHRRLLVVESGQPQDRHGDGAAMLRDYLFGPRLGSGISPARLDRCLLADPLAGIDGTVDQHRRGIDEAPDIEILKHVEKVPRPPDIHRLVERAFPPGEVEVSREVNNRRDPAPMLGAQ